MILIDVDLPKSIIKVLDWDLSPFFKAVKMFQPMPVNRLTDGEICFQIYNIFMKVSIDLVVYKGPFKESVT